MEKKCWERFAAWSFRVGTLLATILRSFATMLRWRKTSMRPSGMTESDRSARRPQLINSGDMAGIMHDCAPGAGEGTGGLHRRGADCCTRIAAARPWGV